jgi:hypothetical protein
MKLWRIIAYPGVAQGIGPTIYPESYPESIQEPTLRKFDNDGTHCLRTPLKTGPGLFPRQFKNGTDQLHYYSWNSRGKFLTYRLVEEQEPIV